MPQVSVPVGGRHYEVACDEGQEEHLRTLAAYMDEKVQDLVRSSRQAADRRLLVMAALLIADELFDERHARRDPAAKGASEGKSANAGADGGAAGDGQDPSMLEDHAAAALEACARRIEALAARVQEA